LQSRCVTTILDIRHYAKPAETLAPLLNIDFEWWSDDAGYDYVPAEPGWAELGPLEKLFSSGRLGGKEGDRPDRIIRRGGKLIAYRPFEKVNGLYRIFANIGTTTDGLLEFIHRFGPLTQEGLDPTIGDEVPLVLSHASTMAALLAYSPEGRVSFLSQFEKGLSWTRIDVGLVVNPFTGKPQITLKPPWLLHGLWLEFGQALSGDVSIKKCAHCGGWFEVGPGTGRREDAKFCCDDHRIAFNSRKRSKGRAEHA
jgi:hypothetical protein